MVEREWVEIRLPGPAKPALVGSLNVDGRDRAALLVSALPGRPKRLNRCPGPAADAVGDAFQI